MFDRATSRPTVAAWRTRISALVICLVVDALVFTVPGMAAGVKTNIPLPIMPAFGISPALGLVPWLTLRLRQRMERLFSGDDRRADETCQLRGDENRLRNRCVGREGD